MWGKGRGGGIEKDKKMKKKFETKAENKGEKHKGKNKEEKKTGNKVEKTKYMELKLLVFFLYLF